jgi:hypothetical protein
MLGLVKHATSVEGLVRSGPLTRAIEFKDVVHEVSLPVSDWGFYLVDDG